MLALLLVLCAVAVAVATPSPAPIDPSTLVDVPSCLRLLSPGQVCPPNLRVPADRTGPVVAAAMAILLTGLGVIGASIAAGVRRLRARRSSA